LARDEAGGDAPPGGQRRLIEPQPTNRSLSQGGRLSSGNGSHARYRSPNGKEATLHDLPTATPAAAVAVGGGGDGARRAGMSAPATCGGLPSLQAGSCRTAWGSVHPDLVTADPAKVGGRVAGGGGGGRRSRSADRGGEEGEKRKKGRGGKGSGATTVAHQPTTTTMAGRAPRRGLAVAPRAAWVGRREGRGHPLLLLTKV
jgi:hypothetical protein